MASLRKPHKVLRQEIFELCLVENPPSELYHQITHHASPALLIALRGEEDLYKEALYVYYKENVMYLQSVPLGCPQDITEKGHTAVESIRHLGFDINTVTSFFVEVSGLQGYPVNSVETIRLNASHNDTTVLSIGRGVRQLGLYASTLKQFSLNVTVSNVIQPVSERVIQQWKRRNEQLLVEIDQIFGVERREVVLPVSWLPGWPTSLQSGVNYTWEAGSG
ncbi:hypothetical protein HYALB_00013938 [Hymenoscyphus albidus]|uniref:Uncharacterized protein n=1 Tax=Hymenoscyphus albidus TaxID=595503 RepID=A0A9N9LXI8_9HELO|nr:hypothetical protein HYALB_00013938 [Hymenoscyphus albidus]